MDILKCLCSVLYVFVLRPTFVVYGPKMMITGWWNVRYVTSRGGSLVSRQHLTLRCRSVRPHAQKFSITRRRPRPMSNSRVCISGKTQPCRRVDRQIWLARDDGRVPRLRRKPGDGRYSLRCCRLLPQKPPTTRNDRNSRRADDKPRTSVFHNKHALPTHMHDAAVDKQVNIFSSSSSPKTLIRRRVPVQDEE